MNEPTIRFPVLTGERFLIATDAAREQITKRLTPPRMEDFKTVDVNDFPAWFVRGVLALLGIVMITSFVISGGKQVAAAGLIFDNMPGQFNHLSSLWSDISIMSMLMLSELGSVLFLIAAGTIGEVAPTTRIAGRDINLTSWIFRAFALLCAGYALISNISVTTLDPVNAVSVLQWVVSVGIPITVLGLGVMLERIIIQRLKGQNDKKVQFSKALATYEAMRSDPTQHTYYRRALFDCLWAEMTRLKSDREKIGTTLEMAATDQQVKLWLVGSEWQAHQAMSEFDLGQVTSPFLSSGAETE